jgi:hypothetical protein
VCLNGYAPLPVMLRMQIKVCHECHWRVWEDAIQEAPRSIVLVNGGVQMRDWPRQAPACFKSQRIITHWVRETRQDNKASIALLQFAWFAWFAWFARQPLPKFESHMSPTRNKNRAAFSIGRLIGTNSNGVIYQPIRRALGKENSMNLIVPMRHRSWDLPRIYFAVTSRTSLHLLAERTRLRPH